MRSTTKTCIASAILGGLVLAAPIASADTTTAPTTTGSSSQLSTSGSSTPTSGSGPLSFLCAFAGSAAGLTGSGYYLPSC
ncbi:MULTISPECIES: hypothetical protein [unclassified Nocardia]|uniref:hypothetical protein n=1 Tax=unclassified Nocardia TaxID=2637762 RepID=UPI0035D94005